MAQAEGSAVERVAYLWVIKREQKSNFVQLHVHDLSESGEHLTIIESFDERVSSVPQTNLYCGRKPFYAAYFVHSVIVAGISKRRGDWY